jgi:hypothetical protein
VVVLSFFRGHPFRLRLFVLQASCRSSREVACLQRRQQMRISNTEYSPADFADLPKRHLPDAFPVLRESLFRGHRIQTTSSSLISGNSCAWDSSRVAASLCSSIFCSPRDRCSFLQCRPCALFAGRTQQANNRSVTLDDVRHEIVRANTARAAPGA